MAISSLYSLYWDMAMDWGFSFRSNQPSFLLRKSGLLMFRSRSIYYVAMISNCVLRMSWVCPLVLATANSNARLQNPWLYVFLAYAEVVRRAVWVIFRLEHEHLNNCGEFRVLSSTAMPTPEESASFFAASSAEGDLFFQPDDPHDEPI